MWALIAPLVLALAELLRDGQADRVWLEMIHGVEVKEPAPRYVVPMG